jgi:hypothetical protein
MTTTSDGVISRKTVILQIRPWDFVFLIIPNDYAFWTQISCCNVNRCMESLLHTHINLWDVFLYEYYSAYVNVLYDGMFYRKYGILFELKSKHRRKGKQTWKKFAFHLRTIPICCIDICSVMQLGTLLGTCEVRWFHQFGQRSIWRAIMLDNFSKTWSLFKCYIDLICMLILRIPANLI